MNASQNNTVAMGHAVSTTLEIITATSGLPVLQARHAALKTKLVEIKAQAAVQALPLTGKTIDRDRVFTEVSDAAIAIAGLVWSYAKANQLEDLASTVRLNPSRFNQGRLAHRVQLAQQIQTAATGVLPQLADYNVTAAMLTELQTGIDAASALLSATRTSIVTRKLATEKLGILIGELVALLENEIDPLVGSLRRTKPDVYRRYTAARAVIDRPGSSTTVTPIEAPAMPPPATTEKLAA